MSRASRNTPGMSVVSYAIVFVVVGWFAAFLVNQWGGAPLLVLNPTRLLATCTALATAIERFWETCFSIYEQLALAANSLKGSSGEVLEATNLLRSSARVRVAHHTKAAATPKLNDARLSNELHSLRRARQMLSTTDAQLYDTLKSPQYVAFKTAVTTGGSLVIGVIIGITARLCIFRAMDFPLYAPTDMLLSGLLIGAGPGPVHSVITSLQQVSGALGAISGSKNGSTVLDSTLDADPLQAASGAALAGPCPSVSDELLTKIKAFDGPIVKRGNDGSGLVLHDANLNFIFWGQEWTDDQDHQELQKIIEGSLPTIIGSQYFSGLSQYGINGASIPEKGIVQAKDITVGSSLGTFFRQFSTQNVIDCLNQLINELALPQPEDQYGYIVIAPKTAIPSEPAVGKHSHFPLEGSGVKMHFAWISCYNADKDEVTRRISHEVVEMCTNPEGTGWKVIPEFTPDLCPPPNEDCEIADFACHTGKIGDVTVQSYWNDTKDVKASIIPDRLM